MFWLDINALKAQLRSGEFKERDIVPYIVADGILSQVFGMGRASAAGVDLLARLVGVAAILIGTWHVFERHDPESAVGFLPKYVALGWVVGFRLFLVFLPVMVIGGFAFGGYSGAFLLLMGALLWLIYYRQLGQCISEV